MAHAVVRPTGADELRVDFDDDAEAKEWLEDIWAALDAGQGLWLTTGDESGFRAVWVSAAAGIEVFTDRELNLEDHPEDHEEEEHRPIQN